MVYVTETEIQNIRLTRAVDGLCEMSDSGDYFDFYDPNGNKVISIAVQKYGAGSPCLEFMFPRGPAMEPLYPAIRNWFKEKQLSWKDRARNGDQYMLTQLEPEPERILDLLKSVQDDILGGGKLKFTTNKTRFLLSISLRQPILGMSLMCLGVAFLVSMIFHELFQIFTIGAFSINNIDRFEWLWIVYFAFVRFILHALKRKPRLPGGNPFQWNSESERKIKLIAATIIFGPMILAFFTVP